MFIQVIQSKSSHHDEVRGLMHEWAEMPDDGSTGFLGATYGFTDDDDFLGVIRFESREKAMANSARPETDAMAKRMAELMDSPPTFYDCDDVTVWLEGGSDDAGFVQIIQGRTDDPDRLKEVMGDAPDDDMRRQRPDIIGGTFALDRRRNLHQHGRVHRRGECARGREGLQPAGGDAVADAGPQVLRPARSLVRLGLTRDVRHLAEHFSCWWV